MIKGKNGRDLTEEKTSRKGYADDTTLTAESEEELKNLLMSVKEESAKNGLKLNIKKTPRSWPLVPSPPGK